MNHQRRQFLERLFDGEPVADDPRDALDDAESLAYLRQLSLLRQLALRHDPAGVVSPRQCVFVPPRSRRRIFAMILAVAASVLFMIVFVRYGQRSDPEPASIRGAPMWTAAGTSVAVVPIGSRRSPRPSLEVELYRWANESSPCREDAAGVVLPRVGSLLGRPASREILALELANATPGSAIRLPRSGAAPATTGPGSIRKPGVSRRHRPAPSPRA